MLKVIITDYEQFIYRMEKEPKLVSMNDTIKINDTEIDEKEFCIDQDNILDWNDETKEVKLTDYCYCNLDEYLEELNSYTYNERDWDLEIDEMKEQR